MLCTWDVSPSSRCDARLSVTCYIDDETGSLTSRWSVDSSLVLSTLSMLSGTAVLPSGNSTIRIFDPSPRTSIGFGDGRTIPTPCSFGSGPAMSRTSESFELSRRADGPTNATG